jgi:hypothetical protein
MALALMALALKRLRLNNGAGRNVARAGMNC